MDNEKKFMRTVSINDFYTGIEAIWKLVRLLQFDPPNGLKNGENQTALFGLPSLATDPLLINVPFEPWSCNVSD